MKSFPRFILIVILSYLGGLFLAWWTVAIAAFVVAVTIPLPPLRSFMNGFIAVFLLWLALAFMADVRNDHILANRMSELILKVKSPILIGVVSAFIGGLTAGLGSLSGSYLRYKRTL
ncbi:MAG: hypothetical protein H6Q26_2202 [Bacteroidetes bacterium]|uniref:hypothetical protein n=1 Tax=Chitinophaga sp. LS1 TaxID=3051176 RepID=UPI001DD757D0|nr:hypothetical protein [Chitinophaga sp. LS1]MBP1652045.1 hypothetical protein [Bacteroidota bacterium]WPV65093.1 hypothetical protein QQL36_25130 [Chitinophaga sp. LS1]